MRKRSRAALISISSAVLVLCPIMVLAQQPNIAEVMKWLDANGLAQARVGVRTSSEPASESLSPVLRQDEYPALSLFYSEGFRVIQGDSCGVVLRNDNTRLIAHSDLVKAPAPDERYTAELFIPLNRLSVTKGRKPYRHTSDPTKAQLLGTWRTEFKSNRSREDVVLTLFAPGQSLKLEVWEAETLTFTFDSKETSEKFNTAFRQAIQICQRVKYLKR